jgi:hypothetical protein
VGEQTEVVGGPEVLESWLPASFSGAVLVGGHRLGECRVPAGPVISVEQQRASNLVYGFKKLGAAHGSNLDSPLTLPPGACTPDDPEPRP